MRTRAADDRLGGYARFEDGVVDRLAHQFAGVDVIATAKWVIDFDKRKGVQNPTGLLVKKVQQAAKRIGTALSPEQERAELARYAAFYVEVYRVVAHQRLGPAAIARMLQQAARDGLPRINPEIISQLEMLGEKWQEPS